VTIVIVAAVLVVARGDSARIEGAGRTDDGAGRPAGPSETATTSPPPTSAPEVTSTTAPTPAPTARPEILAPTNVVASGERGAVSLRCGGTATYGPWNLFDRDPNTGWGASAEDGTGHRVTVTFPGAVVLTSVGITPGFTKVGERWDQGCRAVSAFEFNRFIPRVEWAFDDGTSVVQTFDRRPVLQRLPVDVSTRSLTMTILATEYTGWDNDTVISSMEVRGVP